MDVVKYSAGSRNCCLTRGRTSKPYMSVKRLFISISRPSGKGNHEGCSSAMAHMGHGCWYWNMLECIHKLATVYAYVFASMLIQTHQVI